MKSKLASESRGKYIFFKASKMYKMSALSFFFFFLFPMAAFSADLHVPMQYSTIQSAVNASSSGDTIIVEAGTYNENVGIRKSVTLTSIDPDNPTVAANTIIDAGGAGSAVTFSGGDNELRGFTITGGNSGGIKCQGGNITVANCIITDNKINSGSGKGGGISSDSKANITVIDCTFTKNDASGYGGGIFVDQGELTVEGCTFIQNSAVQEGGGIATDYYKTTIKDCIFIENISDYGGAVHNSHYPSTISNSTFIKNTAKRGGGVLQKELYLGDMTFRINNCSFYENIATEYGGAVGFRYGGEMVMKSCILWNNIAYIDGPQITGGNSGNISVSYSCVQGGQGDIHGGTINWLSGNIDADPLFADASSGDLHLKSQAGRWDPAATTWLVDGSHSPCIDAGDPADPNWALEIWPNGKCVNMGAFGGTAEASKSLSTLGNIADIDSSGLVDAADLQLLAGQWLSTEGSLSENLNGDGIVNLKDLAILAANWGWEQ